MQAKARVRQQLGRAHCEAPLQVGAEHLAHMAARRQLAERVFVVLNLYRILNSSLSVSLRDNQRGHPGADSAPPASQPRICGVPQKLN